MKINRSHRYQEKLRSKRLPVQEDEKYNNNHMKKMLIYQMESLKNCENIKCRTGRVWGMLIFAFILLSKFQRLKDNSSSSYQYRKTTELL